MRGRPDSHSNPFYSINVKDLIACFCDGVVRQARDAGLTSDGHFTVDGSLIQSHASLKSY